MYTYIYIYSMQICILVYRCIHYTLGVTFARSVPRLRRGACYVSLSLSLVSVWPQRESARPTGQVLRLEKRDNMLHRLDVN